MIQAWDLHGSRPVIQVSLTGSKISGSMTGSVLFARPPPHTKRVPSGRSAELRKPPRIRHRLNIAPRGVFTVQIDDLSCGDERRPR